MLEMFKRRRGQKPPLPEILRMTVDRTVMIDPLALKLIPAQSLITVRNWLDAHSKPYHSTPKDT